MGYFMGFPLGEARRNQPVDLTPINPLPENAKSSDSGNAGRDGYSVLSRANRYNGERQPVGGYDRIPPELKDC